MHAGHQAMLPGIAGTAGRGGPDRQDKGGDSIGSASINLLRMQAGRVAAARTASARAASEIAGISGCPHSAACLLRALRLPACVRHQLLRRERSGPCQGFRPRPRPLAAAQRCRQGGRRRQVEVLATIQDARVTMQGVRKNVLPVCKKINKNGFTAS